MIECFAVAVCDEDHTHKYSTESDKSKDNGESTPISRSFPGYNHLYGGFCSPLEVGHILVIGVRM